ncbi:hypothetical protein LCGC14_1519650 [marine sediment metagenome]|uniref:NTP pyrophosphohydrolase MazG putative catalytic core domain-containing protein n=1 Tax=marine sediment metagenome TaxID=412755 RepID=A0A0F9IZ18_9ZZZZ
MSKDWQQDIVDFHKAMNHYIASKPEIPPEKVVRLRHRLIEEEMKETLKAIHMEDLVEIADGIADSIVVLLGTAVSYGIDIRPVWDEVNKSNMAKIGGGKDAGGKSLKPPGWTPPRIKEILDSQM